jgi:enoyl-[acyl-carrier protein] reductase II
MHPEVLEEHIIKTRNATEKSFGVNVPLMYPELDKIMEIIISQKVEIVFTSAGNPKLWTSRLKEAGIKVAHVVSSAIFAEKCENAGVDAIVAEGFEAGGHNGREETTTLALIPSVRKVTGLPLMAAGGIATGRAMLATMALGADGVQIGSRFAVATESSAHPEFKQMICELGEGGTRLSLKKLAPVRLVRNAFYERVNEAELRGATADELSELLGKGRAKKGIFEGDLEQGELEIGQVASLIDSIKPVNQIMTEVIEEFYSALTEIKNGGKYLV